MTDDLTTSDIGNFGGKKFAGTVDVAPTSRLPGFGEQDIQILMSVGKLTPVSDPAPNAPK